MHEQALTWRRAGGDNGAVRTADGVAQPPGGPPVGPAPPLHHLPHGAAQSFPAPARRRAQDCADHKHCRDQSDHRGCGVRGGQWQAQGNSQVIYIYIYIHYNIVSHIIGNYNFHYCPRISTVLKIKQGQNLFFSVHSSVRMSQQGLQSELFRSRLLPLCTLMLPGQALPERRCS